MLRKSQAKQTVAEKQLYCIKLTFLEQKNFKLMYDNAMKLNKSYETFAQTIQNYFKAFHEYCSHIRPPSQQKIMFLYHFRRYIYDYSKIVSRITQYQISCFEAIRENSSDEPLSMALHEVIECVKKYTPFQKQIREKKESLTKEFTIIKGEYILLQKKMKKAKYFYDRRMMRGEFEQLKVKISQNQKAQQTIFNEIIAVDTNTSAFFYPLDTFRKQLLKNKYRQHKRLLELAENSRESLAELFYYQYNCLNDYYKVILKAMQQENDQFSMMRQDQRYKNMIYSDANECLSLVIRNTDDFLNILLGIEINIKQTEKNFSLINKKLTEDRQKGLNKLSFQHINRYFQIDESPVQEMLETINSFQYCFRKLAEKQADVRKVADEIQNIRKEVTKHRGITVSLLKVKLKGSGANRASGEQVRDECGVHEFMNSLDLKPVKYLIKQILDRLLFTFSEILSFFSQQSGSRKKLTLANSMQLSYIEKRQIQVKKKRPVKDELWLWDDYRKRVDTEFTLSKELFNQINAQYNMYKDNGQVDLELQKYECYSDDLEVQGDLCLSKKTVKFTAKSGDKELTLPLGDIEDIKRKKIVIKQYLIVKTKNGDLTFSQFQNLSQVQATLRQTMQSGGAPKAKVSKRARVQLTQTQKAKLQSPQRKQEMQKIRPAVTADYQQVQVKVFQNIGLDQFYDLILSDKKFTLTGKEHESFLVYAMKKFKNKDFKITKFDPPGPKYYTMDESTTFENGPLVSTCKYEYFHLLDMPFLPSQCANHEERKVFWVSDKELDYFLHAQTSGVPLSENFYVELIYKIKEDNNNVELKVYAQIKFLKSFALKSTAQSSTWKEIREGTKSTLEEMQKGINLYKTLLSGKQVQQEEEAQTGEGDSAKQVQKLKQRNFYLIVAVVAILVINIILKLFF